MAAWATEWMFAQIRRTVSAAAAESRTREKTTTTTVSQSAAYVEETTSQQTKYARPDTRPHTSCVSEDGSAKGQPTKKVPEHRQIERRRQLRGSRRPLTKSARAGAHSPGGEKEDGAIAVPRDQVRGRHRQAPTPRLAGASPARGRRLGAVRRSGSPENRWVGQLGLLSLTATTKNSPLSPPPLSVAIAKNALNLERNVPSLRSL